MVKKTVFSETKAIGHLIYYSLKHLQINCDCATFYHISIGRFFRSSHWRCSKNNVFWKLSQNSQENTCTRVSFLIKLQAEEHRCFPVNFAKFSKTPFLQGTSGSLLIFVKEQQMPPCLWALYKCTTLNRIKFKPTSATKILLRIHICKTQKQPFRRVLSKRCSENVQQIYRRTHSSFATLLKLHFGIGVNLLHIFRTPFPNNTSGGLLLKTFVLW